MEAQLKRVAEKREARIANERAMGRISTGQSKTARKMAFYKKQIADMWKELEGTFNNNAIVHLENDLVAKKQNLLELYTHTQGQVKIRQE